MNLDKNDNSNSLPGEVLLRFLATQPVSPRALSSPTLPLVDEEMATCPGVHEYARLAIGRAASDESDHLLAHAATCDRCGQLLDGSLLVLDGNPSPEEAAAIAELAAQKEWQRTLAETLAATKAAQKPGLLSFRSPKTVWLTAGSLAAGLAVAASIGVWQIQRNTPEHELAMAYSQARTLELRISDASFASLSNGNHTRGALGDHESSPLLEARAKLARELERSPQDSHWLALQARADLLEEHYDSAVDVLDRLIAAGPVTSELLTDGASAYYQRGLVTGSEVDRSTALDYLRHADSLAPTDPVILFNEAIVMEDRGQMMNAVEVWNRYITVERDNKWKEEGRRKLAALEQTLNRLKTHQSRLMQLLATPQSMDALAGDAPKLATWDEELSSMELDKLIPMAFPLPSDANAMQKARGSPPPEPPCPDTCRAARRLLKALAGSLEKEHHDFWLTDLLPPDLNSISSPSAEKYAEAMRSLAQATREDQTGLPTIGKNLALKSQQLFHELRASKTPDHWLATAAKAGELRSAVEYMFALQRTVDFRDCRAFAQQFRANLAGKGALSRYPWMDAVEAMTETVCDDTGVTRSESQDLIARASTVSRTSHYKYLVLRARLKEAGVAQNSGDVETAESLALAALQELESSDAPPIRITNTLSFIEDAENNSPRVHFQELTHLEALAWFELTGNKLLVLAQNMILVRTELKLGNLSEAEKRRQLVESEMRESEAMRSASTLLTENRIFLANTMLKSGNFDGAQHYIDLASKEMGSYSDNWGLNAFAGAKGLLALAHGDWNAATKVLETQIRSNEGNRPFGTNSDTAASYTQLDHDLYAELAATWLAQGRPAEQVLALWERFRLRSRGLPGTSCPKDELDCERTTLLTAQQQLGPNVLVGQIVLLDRVLIYRMDRSSVRWTQKVLRRQDLLDTASILQRTASSPYSSLQLAEQLGSRLSEALLPTLPVSGNTQTTLLLEPDPSLQNLPWPLLPTSAGTLGLAYSIAELRSIVAVPKARPGAQGDPGFELIVGASVAPHGEPPLPEAMEEARIVSRYAHDPELLLGNHATTSQVGEALDSATLFHFAGHAIQNGKGTQLLLAANSPSDRSPWIDAAFLRRHPPRYCKLAVLSACATGKRDATWNSPLQDIVETLGSAGVPDVVATRWQIDSKAAVPFMNAFYDNLAHGKNASLALREARKLQSRQSQDNSPYFWAAYYVTETKNLQTERGPHDRQ